jgi:hypothetical protein
LGSSCWWIGGAEEGTSQSGRIGGLEKMSYLGLEAEAAGLIWSDALDRYVHPDEFTNESLKELEILKNG